MSSIEGGTGSIATIYADSHCAAVITSVAALISSSVPAHPVNHAAIDTGSSSTIKDRCAVVSCACTDNGCTSPSNSGTIRSRYGT